MTIRIQELVCANMVRIRKAKGLSQEEVSERLGMTQGQYSRLESGGTNPTLTTLIRVATEGFRCDISEFFVRPEQLLLMEKLRQVEVSGRKGREKAIQLLDLALIGQDPASDEQTKERMEKLRRGRAKGKSK